MKVETVTIEDSSGFQLIRLPDGFKINDDKVYLKKVGNIVYVIPFHHAWQSLISSVHEFSEDFMSNRDQTTEQKREAFD